MDVRVIIETKNRAFYEKEIEMPVIPYKGTILNIKIGDRQHRLVVENLEWEDDRSSIIAHVDGTKMCDSSHYLKDKPDSYLENDSAWRRNW